MRKQVTEAQIAKLRANAVEIREGSENSELLLLCEHGGRGFPAPWGTLGLPEPFLETHFGSDLGARSLTLAVAQQLDATAVISKYSRLFLDYNRRQGDPSCIRQDMGGIPITENFRISDGEAVLRERIAREPVENAVASFLEGAAPKCKVIISIHSFSAIWENQRRSCEIGVMWKDDSRVSAPLIEELTKSGNYAVRDNEPYDFRENDWFTLSRHGLDVNNLHAYIEVRNDLLETKDKLEAMVDALAGGITKTMAKLDQHGLQEI